ncbi:phosphoribosyltransferase [Streptacidiphilus pinicola]|uniref:Phosphoribosyltransferase n=1 Tax=Streptacidiphilus pinicola TaxID=2219663 RepID=A0A2X0I8Q1_9ACTN|nr:phosphoribosyltransferase [Streptacidiphilus pinicola]
MVFADRRQAGRRLAVCLEDLRGEDLVVLGLPRGGVPVAAEVAARLDAPLDVVVVRKLGVPQQPELAMGAIGEGGVRVLSPEIIREAGASQAALDRVEREERAELERRVRRYRGDRPPVDVAGRTAVVVDDGIATGATAQAACRIVRAQGAARIVLAVPVAPRGIAAAFRGLAEEVVVADTPTWFAAIGQFYADFTQTTDAEVLDCLERATSA